MALKTSGSSSTVSIAGLGISLRIHCVPHFHPPPVKLKVPNGVDVGKGGQKRVYTVFNIGGNYFRLVTEIFDDDQTVLIRDVLTHAEYEKEHWKK